MSQPRALALSLESIRTASRFPILHHESHFSLCDPEGRLWCQSLAVDPIPGVVHGSASVSYKSEALLVCALTLCFPSGFFCQGCLNSRNVFSHSSGSLRSKLKVSTGQVSPETSLLSLQRPSPCAVTWSALCAHAWCHSLHPNTLSLKERQSDWIRSHLDRLIFT